VRVGRGDHELKDVRHHFTCIHLNLIAAGETEVVQDVFMAFIRACAPELDELTEIACEGEELGELMGRLGHGGHDDIGLSLDFGPGALGNSDQGI
jgi:hypothetical protein